MAKRIPLPCTPANCGDNFSRCGVITTYQRRKCRCESCCAAKSELARKYRELNREAISERRKQQYAENREVVLERNKRWRDANREDLIQYYRRRYSNNREAVAEWGRRYRAENADAVAERKKKYYSDFKNQEAKREYQHRYHAENRDACVERARQWALANPESRRKIQRRGQLLRRARLKAVKVVDFTPEQFEQKMAYYGHSCYLKLECCTGGFDEIEHVKPIAKLGPHMLANLRPACTPCNRRKSGKWPFAA